MIKAKRKTKWNLEDFDFLRQEKKAAEGSIWKGEKGIYVIRHLEVKPGDTRKHLPVAKVILNSKFLTGLFKTKNNAIFSGDLKEGSKKKFLLFEIIAGGAIQVKVSNN